MNSRGLFRRVRFASERRERFHFASFLPFSFSSKSTEDDARKGDAREYLRHRHLDRFVADFGRRHLFSLSLSLSLSFFFEHKENVNRLIFFHFFENVPKFNGVIIGEREFESKGTFRKSRERRGGAKVAKTPRWFVHLFVLVVFFVEHTNIVLMMMMMMTMMMG